MPATTDTLEALGAISDLAATDILHLMRDPDLVGRVDKKLTAAVLASILSGNSAPRDMLYFNGTDAGSRAYIALGTPGDGIGAGKLTIPLRFRVPEVSVVTNYGLWFIGANNNSYGGGSFAFAAVIDLNGALQVKIVGSGGANVRQLSTANTFRATYAGLWKWLHVTWDGASAPVVYLDGVAIAMTETAGGTLPPWSTVVDDDYFVFGLHSSVDRFAGRMVPFAPFNRVWSPAEVSTHVITGRMPASDEIGTGSMVAQTSGALKIGWRYRITSYLGADSFTNVGAASNATGVEFVAAGTTPTTWSSLSTLIPLGPLHEHGLQAGTYQAGRDMGANGLDLTLTTGVQVVVDGKRRPQVRAKNVNVGTAAYLIQSADLLFAGWDVDCIQISNGGAASAVGVKMQLSDGTNHTDLMATATIAAGDTLLVYPTVGGLDTRRRLRAVATSGADNLTFNFSLRKRA